MPSAMRGARVVVVALGLVQLACAPAAKLDPVGLGERLRELSVPTDGAILDAEAPSSTTGSITMRWTLKAGMSWAQYQSWVTDHLRPEFDEVKRSATKVSFSKLLAGDSVVLELELVSGGDPIGLRATYVMAPD
ncbi:MAG: hypothetical protein ABSH46_16380 [Bryobacteraceae bacterium]|jgi:hypothetical protein